MDRRQRIWGVTTWKEDPPTFDVETMTYMMRVRHRAPETGKEHWHALIAFKKQVYGNGVKKAILDKEAHLRPLQNYDTQYLEDGHTAISAPQEFGEKVKKGARSDIASFKKAIEDGKSISEIAQSHFSCWLKYSAMIPKYRALIKDQYVSKYGKEDFKGEIVEWDKQWHLWGPPDTGKTQFALAQFEHPLYIRHIDEINNFDPMKNDGIVLDEMDFTHWPVNAVINLLNKKDPQQIHIRYTVACLPAGVNMIFCSNKEGIFFDPMKATQEEQESVLAKVQIMHVDKKLF